MRKAIYTEANNLLLVRLRDARRSAGLTQQEVADRLGKPQSFVAKYEGGERRLDLVEFLAVAQVIDADPVRFIEDLRPYMARSGGRRA